MNDLDIIMAAERRRDIAADACRIKDAGLARAKKRTKTARVLHVLLSFGSSHRRKVQ